MDTLAQNQDKQAGAGPGPVGIGGWLILPMLGMIATPLLAIPTFSNLLPLLNADSGLSGFQAFVLWFELISNVVLQLIAPVVMLTLFFRKKKEFPSLYAGWISINLIVVLLDLLFAYNAFRAYYDTPGVEFWDRDTIQLVSRTALGVAIWVPYMFNSVRVQNTFVN